MKKAGWILGAAALLGLGAVALGSKEPKPGNGKAPPGKKPTSSNGGEPVQPWLPEPHDEYTRGKYTIDLTGLGNGTRWRVFLTQRLLDVQPETEAARDALKIHAGVELTEYEAKVAANAFTDALGELVPPVPQPDGMDAGPEPPGVLLRYGLRMTDCSTITVEDLPTWVAWAAPKLAQAASSVDPADAVGEVFGLAFPSCQLDDADGLVAAAEVGQEGVVLSDAIAAVSPTLQAIRDGLAFPATHPLDPSPVEVAAAALVGAKLGRQAPPAFPYRGWVVRVGRDGTGRWAWTIERPGSSPKRSGSSVARGVAINAAKSAVNAEEA